MTNSLFTLETFNAAIAPRSMSATADNLRIIAKLANVDIININIGGKVYKVICDDEGLFKSPLHFSVITKSIQPLIVGNVLICNSEEKSLNISDVIHLTRALCWTSQDSEPIAALLADN